MNAKETVRLSAADINTKISKAIKAFRLQAGMSQTNLAKPLGLTFQQIQKNETGANRVSAGALAVIAQTLGVPVADFYGVAAGGEKFDTMTDFLSMAYAPELVECFGKLTNKEREAVWRVALAIASRV